MVSVSAKVVGVGCALCFDIRPRPLPLWQTPEALGTLLPPHRHDLGYDILAARRGHFQRSEEGTRLAKKLDVSPSEGEMRTGCGTARPRIQNVSALCRIFASFNSLSPFLKIVHVQHVQSLSSAGKRGGRRGRGRALLRCDGHFVSYACRTHRHLL